MFVNRYVVTDAMIKEYVSRVVYHKTKRTGVFFSLLSVIMFFISYRKGDAVFMGVYAVCFLVLAGSLLALCPMAVKQIKESGKKLHNGKSYETVVRFGEDITMEEGACAITVEYGQIERIYYLEHACVLMFGRRNGILLDPKGFTEGSFTEFKEFIESRVKRIN